MLAHFTARITPFGKDRLVRLWLPEGAMEGSDAYPVVYMFDGHNLFRDEWATYGTCWGLADFLARWEKQVIVVAPECDREGNNRLIEYAPYDMDIPPCGLVRGRGAELMDWLLGELKPFVDKAWPTMPFRETTAVGGSSMGGLMAMFAVLRITAGSPRRLAFPRPSASARRRSFPRRKTPTSIPTPGSISAGAAPSVPATPP